MDVPSHNRRAWDQLVEGGNRWTCPVSEGTIARAREGEIEILLTPSRSVPVDWLLPLDGKEVLCLASAGGQQGPVLAAAGAKVTVFDNSPAQLAQDSMVAQRDRLDLITIQGDMADLSALSDESFDLVFHPCSNSFVQAVLPVWKECYRVLRPGGLLLAGFSNPVRYLLDDERTENGCLEVRYPVPYSDLDYLDEPHIAEVVQAGEPLEFGHTLQDQIGGQIDSGFLMTGFFEDRYEDVSQDPLSQFIATFIATRSIKPLS